MSIVTPWIPGARVLDLCAGSGALGLEALSRGATSADFVELNAKSLRALRENIELLGAASTAIVHRGDAVRFVKSLDAAAFDVAFADPPYALGLAASIAEHWKQVPFATLLGVEHSTRDEMPEGGDTRRYGDTAITFFGLDDGASAGSLLP